MWCTPGFTLTSSVRSSPVQQLTHLHPPPTAGGFGPETPAPRLTAVDLNLSITCQIKERFRTLPLLRSSLQSPPSQLQFPGRRTSSGPPNEVIPRTHDWGKLPRHCCFYHRRCRHGLTLLANVSHPPTTLSLPMWKQQVVICIRSLPERVCL